MVNVVVDVVVVATFPAAILPPMLVSPCGGLIMAVSAAMLAAILPPLLLAIC